LNASHQIIEAEKALEIKVKQDVGMLCFCPLSVHGPDRVVEAHGPAHQP